MLLILFRFSLRLFRTHTHAVILLYHIGGPIDYMSNPKGRPQQDLTGE